jgi:predicted Zn-dependent protease with MMP-like domain
VLDVPPDRFEELVADALDSIPEGLGRHIDNVVVRVVERSPDGSLGLYEGIPLTEREQYGALAMPDQISIYRRSILAIARSEAEVVEQVRITVVHEIAHHFGISDDRLRDLGWD